MAPPSPEAIAAFTRVTGASESLARQKLQEHGGNLEEAVNAHFAESDRYEYVPHSNSTDVVPAVSPQQGNASSGSRGILPILSAARSFRPSLLLDSDYRWNLYNQIGSLALAGRSPPASHAGEFNGGYRTQQQQQQNLPGPVSSYPSQQAYGFASRGQDPASSEEEMIRLAIEASREEHISGGRVQQTEDDEDELARVMALSLKTAEQEQQKRVGMTETRKELAGGTAPKYGTKESDSNKGKLPTKKEVSLPYEPAADDKNSVGLIVHMPEGNRLGRRFLKSHKLQSLFDFIDAEKAVKQGSYRVVRQYPRRAYGIEDGESSFEDVGLTNKHEEDNAFITKDKAYITAILAFESVEIQGFESDE